MDKFYSVLKQHITDYRPNFDNNGSVLALLYKVYSKCNRLDDDLDKTDFKELYHQMNGMTLQEMD